MNSFYVGKYSVAAITKKKPLWYFGIAMVSGWVFFFLDAILLFY